MLQRFFVLASTVVGTLAFTVVFANGVIAFGEEPTPIATACADEYLYRRGELVEVIGPGDEVKTIAWPQDVVRDCRGDVYNIDPETGARTLADSVAPHGDGLPPVFDLPSVGSGGGQERRQTGIKLVLAAAAMAAAGATITTVAVSMRRTEPSRF